MNISGIFKISSPRFSISRAFCLVPRAVNGLLIYVLMCGYEFDVWERVGGCIYFGIVFGW